MICLLYVLSGKLLLELIFFYNMMLKFVFWESHLHLKFKNEHNKGYA